ncbi:fused (3R)-hydroxyacyl-ACP dehydratase subunits HadA/HadB [Williamsia muralis]|uniref:(R)-hydratase n=1 Tax=Williamsia marianensis TaxID=85044 RepID=A0A2G3PJE6_WILMA|nr:fused (3R)-hydroxyacyl-ACP dehydratase subunits HadA/HadB [Williamsia marianensis]PHV65938.1 (R)-hydratase [Williamsia marianensis]PZT97452.1 MAG: (R)-hydratase [Gordonia sp. (in: high G+C Gram-positive bacteria)]
MSVQQEAVPAADVATSLLGRPYRLSDTYEVGREKIREFARAVQDHHLAHYDVGVARALGHEGLVAPITFTAILGGISQRCVFEQFLPGYDLSQVLQTEQRIRQHRPLRAGDDITCRITLDAFRAGHGQDSFVLRTDMSDQTGALVQTGWTTAVARSGGVVDENIAQAVEGILMRAATEAGGEIGSSIVHLVEDDTGTLAIADSVAPQPKRRFADVSVGDEISARTVQVARGDLVNYAGVSGDENPIHWSEQVVDLAGLDNVVAHGMLTMAFGGGYLSEWVGDPGAVIEYGVRFTRPVFVEAKTPAEVTYTGKIKELDETNRTATIVLTATARGSRIFGKATAIVQLA